MKLVLAKLNSSHKREFKIDPIWLENSEYYDLELELKEDGDTFFVDISVKIQDDGIVIDIFGGRPEADPEDEVWIGGTWYTTGELMEGQFEDE